MPYYTWWFEYNALEIFEPLNGIAPQSMWSLWTAFLDRAPEELIAAIEEHDERVEELRQACAALQRGLEESGELKNLYERFTSDGVLAELQTDLKTLLGARFEGNHCSYLAQLIVNSTPADCSPLYTIRPLWMRYGAEFLALRETEAFRDLVRAQLTAAERLNGTIGVLLEFLPPAPAN